MDESASATPNYRLTVIRVKPDEGKALIPEGVLVMFDLEKDLGLTGNFTYSVTNPVQSVLVAQSSEESLLAIIEKYFTFNFTELKEVKPEPFDHFVMDHDYFSCYLPARWKLERDQAGDERAGIYEINLTMPEKAKPEDGDKYYQPDPLIYVGYYAENNQEKKTREGFLQDYDELAKKREGSDQSHFDRPKSITFDGKEAWEITYEVYQELPHGPLFTIKFWLKVKFIMVKAKDGFYVLAYKSPVEFHEQYLPAFEEVVGTFRGME